MGAWAESGNLGLELEGQRGAQGQAKPSQPKPGDAWPSQARPGQPTQFKWVPVWGKIDAGRSFLMPLWGENHFQQTPNWSSWPPPVGGQFGATLGENQPRPLQIIATLGGNRFPGHPELEQLAPWLLPVGSQSCAALGGKRFPAPPQLEQVAPASGEPGQAKASQSKP